MLVFKLGDDFAVRLPKSVADSLGLKEGDEVDILPKPMPIAKTQEEREEALKKLRSLRGWMPADFKFNREEANER